jgi:phosphoglycolate phosphatase-like HAD superfamily hydrolase
MSELPFPFDAVLFDLDGTLVATDRFWVRAANLGAGRAFAELGLARELPSEEQWMGMVGLPIDEAFDAVFADLAPGVRAIVMRRCMEAEQEALRAGGAAPLPGALETLAVLRGRGVKLAIASNCGREYLDTMLTRLPLGELVHESRCLDSDGVSNKAGMLTDLLEVFGTRSAVMVGDRRTDAEAAHANALPHVHLADGFAQAGETFACEATLAGLGALIERLEGRSRWIDGVLDELGAYGDAPPASIGITGRPLAGKTLFARDAARILEARTSPTEVLDDPGPAERVERTIRLEVSEAVLESRSAVRGGADGSGSAPGPVLATGASVLSLPADNPLGPDGA